jgi:hypothetical protein
MDILCSIIFVRDWERDEYEIIDLSAMNMFKRVSNGEIVSDDEEEEGEPSLVDA